MSSSKSSAPIGGKLFTKPDSVAFKSCYRIWMTRKILFITNNWVIRRVIQPYVPYEAKYLYLYFLNLQLSMQRKRTDWEETHEDVISDYLQVVESQVIYSFICMFSKSSLVNMYYLQKKKKYVFKKKRNKTNRRNTTRGRIHLNKSNCAVTALIFLGSSLGYRLWCLPWPAVLFS